MPGSYINKLIVELSNEDRFSELRKKFQNILKKSTIGITYVDIISLVDTDEKLSLENVYQGKKKYYNSQYQQKSIIVADSNDNFRNNIINDKSFLDYPTDILDTLQIFHVSPIYLNDKLLAIWEVGKNSLESFSLEDFDNFHVIQNWLREFLCTRDKLMIGKERGAAILDIMQSEDIEILLRKIVEWVSNLIGVKACCVFLQNPDNQNEIVLKATNVKEAEHMNPRKKGVGLTGWVYERGETLRIGNMYDKDEWEELYQIRGVSKKQWLSRETVTKKDRKANVSNRSFIAIPLFSGKNGHKEVIGVLRIGSTDFTLTKREEDILKKFASFISQYLKKILFIEKTIQKCIDMGLTTDLNDLLSKITDVATHLVGCDSCSIYLRDKNEKENYVLRKAVGFMKGKEGNSTFKPEDGITGLVIKEKRSIRISNIRTPEWKDICLNIEGEFTEPNSPCFLGVPIVVDNEVNGMVRLSGPKYRNEFSEENEILLNILAKGIADVIRKREEFYRVITSLVDIGGETDIDLLCYLIVEKALTVINGAGCSIFLKEKWGEEVRYVFKATKSGNKDFHNFLKKKEESGEPFYYNGKGRGLTNAAIRTKTSIKIDDFYKRDELTEKIGEEHVRNNEKTMPPCEISDDLSGPFLVVPIIGGQAGQQEVIGVIRIPREKKDGPFSDEEEYLLSAFASHMAGVIQKGQKRDEIVEKLIGIGQKKEKDELWSEAVTSLKMILNADSCSVFVKNSMTEDIVLAETTDENFKSRVGMESYKKGEGKTGWAYQNNRIYKTCKDENDDTAPCPQKEFYESGPPNSYAFIAAPVTNSIEDVVAVIRLQRNIDNLGPFTSQDEALLTTIVKQVSISYSYCEELNAQRILKALNTIDRHIFNVLGDNKINDNSKLFKLQTGLLYVLTSGEGLGFNRAAFFSVNENKTITGTSIAVGAYEHAEAQKIWGNIKESQLEEVLKKEKDDFDKNDLEFKKVIKNIKISGDKDISEIRIEIAKKMNIDIQYCELIEIEIKNMFKGYLYLDNKFFEIPTFKLLDNISLFIDKIISLIEHYRSKTDTLNEIAHNLKTPVHSMLMAIYQLEKKNLDKKTKEVISDFHYNTSEFSRQVFNLINNARIDRGNLLANKKDQSTKDFEKQIEKIINSFAFRVKMLGITIDTDISFNDTTIIVDPDNISLVISNLIDNAINFTDDNKTIDVTAGIEGNEMFVKVFNPGEPISTKIMELIFDRYFTTTNIRKDQGMGLGLFISKSIIDAHGGTIEVANVNSGTRFLFRIPV